MKYRVELEQEDDGRWIADVPELPGVLCYGATQEAAVKAAEVLVLRVLAERIEHGEQADSSTPSVHFDLAGVVSDA